MAADFNNAPPSAKKALYVEQNSFGIPHNALIYRIFQFPYLVEDIKKKQLTHVRPEVWNDLWENPLLNHVFTEPSTGEKVSLRGIIEKLFAQSWTFSSSESFDFWDEFSRGTPAVCVQNGRQVALGSDGLGLSGVTNVARLRCGSLDANLLSVEFDGFFSRLKRKARANQLAIALGGDLSGEAAIPRLAEQIRDHFRVEIDIKSPPYEHYLRWNKLIELVEQSVSRETLMAFIEERANSVAIQPIHRKIACLPISNFIDFTFDRSLTKALMESGKQPIVHDFFHHSMGSWRQSNPDRPNVFFSFADLKTEFPIFGVYEQLCRDSQNRIQLENMMEMLREKDLLILSFSSFEAEGILHLEYLAGAADKVVNTSDPIEDYSYWTKRGVFLARVPTEAAVDYLLPSNLRSYTGWDLPIPSLMLIDVAKEKQYDCFICYFSGDKAFAVKLQSDLRQRDLRPWRDEGEIEVGDSISEKLEQALKNSYSFVIILSKEALERPWVREELRAALSLRIDEQLKILPVLYKDCEMPVFLMDYKHADFREEKNYSEQLEFLARSIQNAVKRARRKK